MVFESSYRVYYEDTDAGGVVYHTNYLKFAERARTDMLRGLDIDHSTLVDECGLVFVVADIHIAFKKSARLDDLITVKTHLENITAASLILKQILYHKNEMLVEMEVTVVCVDKGFKPKRLPEHIRLALS